MSSICAYFSHFFWKPVFSAKLIWTNLNYTIYICIYIFVCEEIFIIIIIDPNYGGMWLLPKTKNFNFNWVFVYYNCLTDFSQFIIVLYIIIIVLYCNIPKYFELSFFFYLYNIFINVSHRIKYSSWTT